MELTHKGDNKRSKYVTQLQQQRLASPKVTLTWQACKHKVHKHVGEIFRDLVGQILSDARVFSLVNSVSLNDFSNIRITSITPENVNYIL